MGVNDKSQDKESVKSAEEVQKAEDKKFLDELAGISSDEEKEKTGEESEETEEKETEESEETEPKEGEEETKEGEETESEEEESEEEESKEPSPSQKRINELTREKKRLERELAAARGEKSDSPRDPDLVKLEKMSIEELRTLKNECKLSSRTEKDEAKVRRFIELEDKIDSVIQSAPQRFEASQLAQYRDAVAETQDEFGEKFTEGVQAKIFEKAKAIFGKSPSLQRAADGQAVSWQLAVDWYKDTSKLSLKADRSAELERDVNKLKKKVTLDTAVARGAAKETESARNFKRAKQGDKRAELEFFKHELGL